MLEGDARDSIFGSVAERFGIPLSSFDPYLLFKKGKSLWLMRRSDHLDSAFRLRVSMVGMRAFQVIGNFIKPSTRMIRFFGHGASRARIDLKREQLVALLEQGSLKADLGVEDGYVIMSFKGRILGVGLLLRGEIRSQLPQREIPHVWNATGGSGVSGNNSPLRQKRP
ncbi:MAG: hypothetical protein JRJ03_11035 [Deltaproteobacteria bacterium]|nr:hypothetical protein [Deltaproteobacteria bacterium]MBW2065451.1 hypothetical protein [Deltaproteobacteria bacterium]